MIIQSSRMKNTFLFTIAITITALSFSNDSRGQAPNLGSAVNYVLFSTIGAVSNAGISQITGNVGSNNGATTGFGTLSGQLHNADLASAQCSIDLLSAYNQLNLAVPTLFPGVLLGNGQILDAGVYAIPAATSLNLTLTLDAQGNPNAVFIFQINGAFSTNTLSRINLINQASACNVFWKVEGAVSMAAASSMAGTIIANNAAISLAAGDTLEGRALSTTGAVAVNGVLANVGCGFVFLPLELSSFTGSCDNQSILLKWSTASEVNNHYFTIERSATAQNWLAIGTVNGAGNSVFPHAYSFIDSTPSQPISYYRLMQTDFEGNNTYGPVVVVERCGGTATGGLTIFPNPSAGEFNLLFTGDKAQVYSIEVFNSLGERVFGSTGFLPAIDLTNKATGIYFVQVHLPAEIINRQIVLRSR
jgi:hypothetical protein